LALTSTPSIAVSSCELTWPVSADADDVWALTGPATTRLAKTVAVRADVRVARIWLIIFNPPSSFADLPHDRGHQ
jgi:hypothetical protein